MLQTVCPGVDIWTLTDRGSPLLLSLMNDKGHTMQTKQRQKRDKFERQRIQRLELRFNPLSSRKLQKWQFGWYFSQGDTLEDRPTSSVSQAGRLKSCHVTWHQWNRISSFWKHRHSSSFMIQLHAVADDPGEARSWVLPITGPPDAQDGQLPATSTLASFLFCSSNDQRRVDSFPRDFKDKQF